MSGVLNKVFISIISSSIDTQNTPKETTKLETISEEQADTYL